MKKRRKKEKVKGKGKKGKFKFKYHRRSEESIKKRAKQRGGSFDPVWDPRYTIYKAKEGDNLLRILPRVDEKADDFGIEAWVHSSVGPDNQQYLCRESIDPDNLPDGEEPSSCAVCDEIKRANRENEADYAKEMRPYKRVLVWVIDRDKEGEGPQLYPMPWTIERDIATLSVDKRTKEIFYVDEPEDGYDVEFHREGTTQTNTKYSAVRIARRSSPLSDDEDEANDWLRFVGENPLRNVLVLFEYDHIEKSFAGKEEEEEDDDDDEEEERPRSRKTSKKKKRRREEEDDDEEDDDDDDDEEEEQIDDEDEDLDEDSEEEDEEDDDDDDDDDEEEEEEEPPRKKKRGNKKSKRRRR
jgi:hypothetical protein